VTAKDNKRVWKQRPDGSQEVYFYVGNKKLGTYAPVFDPYTATLTFTTVSTQLWFGSRKVETRDRVGSVMTSGDYVGATSRRFYPYGEEITTPSLNADGFATYYRDGNTGLDYADQRYYASQFGRFGKKTLNAAKNIP
jgi:hypothetical protein